MRCGCSPEEGGEMGGGDTTDSGALIGCAERGSRRCCMASQVKDATNQGLGRTKEGMAGETMCQGFAMNTVLLGIEGKGGLGGLGDKGKGS